MKTFVTSGSSSAVTTTLAVAGPQDEVSAPQAAWSWGPQGAWSW